MLILCIINLLLIDGFIVLYLINNFMGSHRQVKIKRLSNEITCTNCVHYIKCQEENNSFEFAEYSKDWAKWCDNFEMEA